MKPLLEPDEVCRLLGGVSRAWLNDHASGRRSPIIPSVGLGRIRRFRPEDVTQFIEDCRCYGNKPAARGRAA
jgi:hypothetical protein